MNPVGKRNEPAREAWIERALARVPAGSKLLDAGAGECQFMRFCAHLDYVSQDFAEYDGTGDGSGLQTKSWDRSALDIVSDITAIPRPDASFDAILCTEVFEHIPDPRAALREFSRLLRPGGWLILTVPFCSLTHFAPYHFSTGLSRHWHERYLPANGFAIDTLESNGNYFEFVAQELRRTRGIANRYANDGWTESEQAAVGSILSALDRFSAAGAASSELLCFGWHVIARRATAPRG